MKIYPLIAVYGFSRITVSADKCGFALYEYLRQNPIKSVKKIELNQFMANFLIKHGMELGLMPNPLLNSSIEGIKEV